MRIGISRPNEFALLVLDVQNYFFQESSPAYLAASRGILPVINALVEKAAAAGWLVVFTTHHAPSGQGNLMADKWRHLPSGEESELYSELIVPEGARRIRKEHYSAFWKTNLDETLRERDTKTVVICGVMTHLCVDTTARHAFMLGWSPVIVEDACCSKAVDYHRAALLALRHGIAEITTSRDLRAAIE